MYTFLIDDTSNALEPRGASRRHVDELLNKGVAVSEAEIDQRAVEAAAVKDSMFGGASY